MPHLYVHIPFCRRLCAYCDFYKSLSETGMERLPEALERELEAEAGFLPAAPLRTIYFGGGTPSLLPASFFARFIAGAVGRFGGPPPEEVTVEANPDDMTDAYARALLEAGCNRLSLGIQSLDDGQLVAMNRRHTAREAVEAVRIARSAGFDNLSGDLLYGWPPGDDTVLERTLDAFLALDLEHVSAYHLTVEPHTVLGRRAARGLFHPVDERVSERHFALVHRRLTEAGYEHYEVSNFARPGFRARHNAAYWHGAPYLGLGPSAHSYDGAMRRRWTAASVERYLTEAGTPVLYEEERLGPVERYDEYVMTRLRCAEGIEASDLEARFGSRCRARFAREAARFVDAGTLCATEAGWRIPAERFLLSDQVIAALFADGDVVF